MSNKAASFKFNRCDFYIAGWCMYYLQGTLYPEGGTISKSILVVMMLVSIGYAIYANLYYRLPAYLKGTNALLVMFTVYWLAGLFLYGRTGVVPIGGGAPLEIKDYLQTIYLSFLSLYAFYVFAGQGYLTKRNLRCWVIVFFVIVTLSFFYEQKKRIAYSNVIDAENHEFTINAGYVFLSLVPSLFLYREKPIVQYLGLVIISSFVLLSAKRGAILICIIAAGLFMIINLIIASKVTRNRLALFSVLTVCAITFFSVYRLNTSVYLNNRIEETKAGNTSGRSDIYSSLFKQYIHENSYSRLLLGNGVEGTYRTIARFAHQDWLEIMTNQGLLGVLVYIAYWICFLASIKKMKSREAKVALILLFAIYFLKSMFSMSYQSMSYYTNSVLGYYLATGFDNETDPSDN